MILHLAFFILQDLRWKYPSQEMQELAGLSEALKHTLQHTKSLNNLRDVSAEPLLGLFSIVTVHKEPDSAISRPWPVSVGGHRSSLLRYLTGPSSAPDGGFLGTYRAIWRRFGGFMSATKTEEDCVTSGWPNPALYAIWHRPPERLKLVPL